MCSNEKSGENPYHSSMVADLVDKTVKDHTVIEEEIRRLVPRGVGVGKKAQKAKAQLASSRKKSIGSQENLARIKCQVMELQNQCEKFMQSNEALSSRIADLANRIILEKKTQIGSMNELEKLLQALQRTVANDIFGARTIETTLASLHEEGKALQGIVANVDQYLPRAEAQFESVAGQKWNPSAARLLLTAEEKASVLAIFETEASACERLLKATRGRRESLQREISRFSENRRPQFPL